MITVEKNTPNVYYNKSRDFQLLGRLIDIVFNSVKSSADMIYTVPNGNYAGSSMINLLATTLGFKQKHEYSLAQLVSVCSMLNLILRKKGTLEALELACSAILRGDGITDTFHIEPASDMNTGKVDTTKWFVMIPKLKSITLLNDLLDYILPAGVSCSIAEGSSMKANEINTIFTTTQTVQTTVTNNNYNKSLNTASQEDKIKHSFMPLENNGLFASYNKDNTASDFTNALVHRKTDIDNNTTVGQAQQEDQQ